ncbi:MAG TPA: c-type cytochrome [Planctomycetota bacterium]|nr:c-type cytochrome [Planctomycetota bacterium]
MKALILLVAVLLVGGGAAWSARVGPAGNVPPRGADESAGDGATLALADWPLDAGAGRGQAVYERWCIGCHGREGRGDGEAAAFLDPLPRDFQSAAFKFRSTPSGELPRLDDIMHVVRCGLRGSSMPSFPLLPQEQLRDVAAYVLSLAEFGLLRREVEYVLDDEGLTLQQLLADRERLAALRAEVLADAYESVWPVAMPPRPPDDAASRARGAELYVQQCVACHGSTGLGDGRSSFHLRDSRDAVIRPRDFTTGIFRAGSRPEDLFLRLRTGLNGTPMPAIAGSDEELWHLTHYILSLKDPGHPARPHPTACEHDAADRRPPAADGTEAAR